MELGEQAVRWWSRKYKLPRNHPLCTSRTEAELLLEMYEDMVDRRDELHARLGEPGVEADEVMRQINGINEVFEVEEEVYDPLVAKWEQEILEGKVPDLDAELEG